MERSARAQACHRNHRKDVVANSLNNYVELMTKVVNTFENDSVLCEKVEAHMKQAVIDMSKDMAAALTESMVKQEPADSNCKQQAFKIKTEKLETAPGYDPPSYDSVFGRPSSLPPKPKKYEPVFESDSDSSFVSESPKQTNSTRSSKPLTQTYGSNKRRCLKAKHRFSNNSAPHNSQGSGVMFNNPPMSYNKENLGPRQPCGMNHSQPWRNNPSTVKRKRHIDDGGADYKRNDYGSDYGNDYGATNWQSSHQPGNANKRRRFAAAPTNPPGSDTLYVGSIPRSVTLDSLRRNLDFRGVWPQDIRWTYGHPYCFLVFANHYEASQALRKLSLFEIDGCRSMRVEFARTSYRRPSSSGWQPVQQNFNSGYSFHVHNYNFWQGGNGAFRTFY